MWWATRQATVLFLTLSAAHHDFRTLAGAKQTPRGVPQVNNLVMRLTVPNILCSSPLAVRLFSSLRIITHLSSFFNSTPLLVAVYCISSRLILNTPTLQYVYCSGAERYQRRRLRRL
jgi:hypothetical protein